MIDHPHDPEFAPKSLNPLEDQAEVVANCGKDWVDGIAFGVGEVIAVHAVARFDMANHRFNGRAAFHLAFDGGCDPSFLACGKDTELVA